MQCPVSSSQNKYSVFNFSLLGVLKQIIKKFVLFTVAEAQNRWNLLLEHFYDEENLLAVQSGCDEDSSGQFISEFPHYRIMKDMLTSSSESKVVKLYGHLEY